MRIETAQNHSAITDPVHRTDGASPTLAASGMANRHDNVGGGQGGDRVELSAEAKREVERLKKVDAEVRAHEQAHMTAGGPHISGGARFQYTRGPDGRQYAVGGEVSIDTSTVDGNPQATLRKAQAIARAALAPMEPSGQDRSVAAAAAQMEAQARMELSRENNEKSEENTAGPQADPMQNAIDQYASMMAEAVQPPANQWTA